MNCIKRPGLSLIPRDVDRPIARIQLCVAGLNRYTVPGIPVTGPHKKTARGKGQCAQTPICVTKPLRRVIAKHLANNAFHFQRIPK